MLNFHLLPDGDRWKITTEDAKRRGDGFKTKEEALEVAIRLASEAGGSLKIHAADGTIQEERTYPRSADPRKTPG